FADKRGLEQEWALMLIGVIRVHPRLISWLMALAYARASDTTSTHRASPRYHAAPCALTPSRVRDRFRRHSSFRLRRAPEPDAPSCTTALRPRPSRLRGRTKRHPCRTESCPDRTPSSCAESRLTRADR